MKRIMLLLPIYLFAEVDINKIKENSLKINTTRVELLSKENKCIKEAKEIDDIKKCKEKTIEEYKKSFKKEKKLGNKV